MDVVSDVLNNVIVRNRVTGLLRLHGDWAFDSPEADEAVFHLVFRGELTVTYKGETIRMQQGDMIMFTRGQAHRLGSAEDAPLVTFAENDTRVRMHSVQSGEVASIEKNSAGPETSIICARFNFDSQTARTLVSAFPDRIVLLGMGDSTFAPFEGLLSKAAREAHSDEPGALAELDALVQLLYLSFMRNWLTKASTKPPSWVKGLRDPHIAQALQLMHSDPSRSWTVQELASSVGMSRSNFAARFAQVTDQSPLRYLMRWRMSLAAHQLESQPAKPVSAIAADVGYDSEATFSTSFKRALGKSPSVWRKESLEDFRAH